MLRKTLILAVAVAVLGPARGRADDRDWQGDYDNEGEWSDQGGDVSVDMGVSASVDFDTFQGSLSPYGDWVVAGRYGRVWRPHVAAGWRPYYYGRWEWTDEGWLWVSDEPFGWATYHYGRWAWEPGYGWVWVPGYEWAPAWVFWRYSGDAIGWAPLAPGFSIYVDAYPFYDYWWTFVPTVRFVGLPVYRIAYAPSYTRRWYDATRPAPPRGRPAPVPGGRGGVARAPAWGGPAPRFVQERSGRPVTPVRIAPASRPGEAASRPGVVSVFRPGVRGAAPGREPGRGPAVAPAPGNGRFGPAVPRGEGRGPGGSGAPGFRPPVERGGQADRPVRREMGERMERPSGAERGSGGDGPRAAPAPRGGGERAAPAPRHGGGGAPQRGGGGRGDAGSRGEGRGR